jgi:sec-independent protein translocase protein TatA
MGSLSIWHWIIAGAVVLLLFGGRGKISELMGDFAKGIKSFKKGLAEEDTADVPKPADPKVIDHHVPPAPAPASGAPVAGGTPADTRKVG